MKALAVKCIMFAFCSLFSSSMGDSVQDEIRTLKSDIFKLEKTDHGMGNRVEALEEEVPKLKEENSITLEKVKSVDFEMQRKNLALSEEVKQLKAENQKILDKQRDLEAELMLMSRKPFVNQMVTSPTARLYSGENFTGEFEDYTFETADYIGGCHELTNLKDKVASLDTFGSCVRLFEYRWCDNRSVSVYPGSNNANKFSNSAMPIVRSIGPCPAEEFEDFDFKDGTKQAVVKKPSNPKKFFPDLIHLCSTETQNNVRTVTGSKFSVAEYLLGSQNQVEFLHGEIYPRHLSLSQPEFEMQSTRIFRSLDKQPGDTVGYGISPSFGGPVNESYNAFPQTVSSTLQWNKLTSGIRPFFESGGDRVKVCLNFAYEDETKSRPTGFYFWIGYFRGWYPQRISYGRVEN